MTRISAMSLLLVCGLPAIGQPPPNQGYQWATIGAVGNAAFPGDQFGHLAGRGSVGYEFRMATTEVTNSDWIDFCRAYAPYYQGNATIPPFTGSGIYGSSGPNGYEYEIAPGFERVPTAVTWRLGARYCNWLTNGRVNQPWAFERGAYDTSTFTQNPDGSYNDQRTHAPGALYWIPSADEWIKAAYYDPNTARPSQGGWWDYPYALSAAPIPGPPGEGGQTNAAFLGPSPESYQVGLYAALNAPWGLLDVSGGMSEMTEELKLFGSSISSDQILQPFEDRLGSYLQMDDPNWFAYNGLRLASAVPAPGTYVICGVIVTLSFRRNRM